MSLPPNIKINERLFRRLIWPAFLLLVLAQWWIPARMIAQKEKVLSEGVLYRFQTAPIDPNDPFRGRYVILNYKENSCRIKSDSTLTRGSRVYLTFTPDSNGYARIRTLSKSKPSGTDFLETGVSYAFSQNDSTNVFFNYPFNAFYMEEYKAPKAEQIYTETSTDSAQKAYALVSIFDGDAVVKDVFINDSSIRQVIMERDRRK